MGKVGGAIRNSFVWTYARGTLPYDIICASILLFIFLTPRSCFTKKPASNGPAAGMTQGSAVPAGPATGK